jgi:hypothetical protein
MRHERMVVWSCGALLVASGAMAQGRPSAPSAVTSEGKVAGRTTQRDPSASSPLHGIQPLFSFLASTFATEATASAGLNLTPQGNEDRTVAFTLTGPISKATQATDLADLNGLVGTARGEINVARTSWKQHFKDVNLPRALCAQNHVTGLCTRGNVPASARDAWDDNVTMAGSWFVSGDAQGSRQQFQFRDAGTLRPGSLNGTPFAVSGSGGLYFGTNAILQGTFEYQEWFRSGISTQLCLPVGPPGALRCDTGVLGRPSRQTSSIATVEWRYSHGSEFALSPTVHYDLNQRVAGIELPLWAIRDASGGLAGGVRLGYRSDLRHATIVGFIGDVARPQ